MNLGPGWCEKRDSDAALFSLLGLLLLLFTGCHQATTDAQVPEPQRSLLEVVDGWRYASFRLDPEWSYESLGSQDQKKELRARRLQLAEVELSLKHRLRNSPDFQTQLEWVWLKLIWQEADAALTFLDQMNPEDPAMVNYARAVAYLIKNDKEPQPMHLFSALHDIDSALKEKPQWPPALFNRGIILQKLGFFKEAVANWEQVLRFEIQSEWRLEAEAHSRDMDRLIRAELLTQQDLAQAMESLDAHVWEPMVDRDTQVVRKFLEEDVILKWAQAQVQNSPKSASLLKHLSWIVDFIKSKDVLLIQAMAEELQEADHLEKLTLARGHLQLGEARAALKQFQFVKASHALRQAAVIFGEAPSVGSLMVIYYQAELLFYQRKRPQAFKAFVALAEQLPPEHYPSLKGRINWMLGLLAQFEVQPLRAEVYLQRALACFQELGEHAHTAGILSLMGENKRFLGQTEAAFNHWFQARSHLSKTFDARRGYALAMFANRLMEDYDPELAPYFLDEAQSHAKALNNPQSEVYTHLMSARAWLRINSHRQALFHLNAAKKLIPSPSEPLWDAMIGQLNLLEAQALLVTSPTKSRALLESAKEKVQTGNRKILEEELYRIRADLHLRLGHTPLAEADLKQSITILEALARETADANQNPSVQRKGREVFEKMIRLQWQAGHAENAWRYAERFKTAITAFPTKTEKVVKDFEQVQANLPDGVALVVYVLGEASSMCWILQKDQIKAISLKPNRKEVATLVERLHRHMTLNESHEAVAKALFAAVIQPVFHGISQEKQWVIVPDGALHSLPFGLLRESESHAYLCETWTLVFAPSVTRYLQSLENYKQQSLSKTSALIVGDPSFDTQQFPQLKPLPGALAEASAVASFFIDHQWLAQDQVTPKALTDAMATAEAFHYSGHVMTGALSARFDHLVLAPSAAKEPGVLYAQTIGKMNLANLAWVNLAACAPNRGREMKRSNGLVAAFLHAGVPAVMAHSWDMDDAQTQAFMTSVYRQLEWGKTPAVALQMAQKDAIQKKLPAKHWAGFQIYGGVPPQN